MYPELRVAVPPLVRLLGDEEDKTRANAAAALGNLVRNSAALCGDLVRAGESISIPVWAIRMTCFFNYRMGNSIDVLFLLRGA